jgi:predicted nucleic acid-binding protein
LREPAVTDSTCLIGLDRIGRLDLLPKLFDPIAAPPEVEREWGLSAPWLRIEPPSNPSAVTALKMLVDDGEAEAIALATERQHRIILDDRRARDLAHRMGLKVIGTVGILIRAKRVGLLPWIKPVLNELTEKGFRLSEDLKREALSLAGE